MIEETERDGDAGRNTEDTQCFYHYNCQVITDTVFVGVAALCYAAEDHVHTVYLHPKVPSLKFMASRSLAKEKEEIKNDIEKLNSAVHRLQNCIGRDLPEKESRLDEVYHSIRNSKVSFCGSSARLKKCLEMFLYSCEPDEEDPDGERSLEEVNPTYAKALQYYNAIEEELPHQITALVQSLPPVLPSRKVQVFATSTSFDRNFITLEYCRNRVHEIRLKVVEVRTCVSCCSREIDCCNSLFSHFLSLQGVSV